MDEKVELKPKPVVWNLHDALEFVREIQPEIRSLGFHVALAGGVPNKGYSHKDLDLVFIPLTNDKAPNATNMASYMNRLLGAADLTENNGTSHSPNPYSPFRQQFTFPATDKYNRVDIFIV